MLVIGAVFALGMAIIGVGVIRGAAAAEAAPITGFTGPSLTSQPLPLINRQEPSLAETDGRVGDREQLKRYFLQDRRDWLMR
jgi:hypothetical protein